LKSLDNVPGKQRSRDSDGSKNKKYFRRLSEQDAALCRGHIICVIEPQDGRFWNELTMPALLGNSDRGACSYCYRMPHNTRAVFSSGWQYPGGRFETKNGRVSYQRPCKPGSASVYKDLAQPVNKVPIVDLVFKYGLHSIPRIMMGYNAPGASTLLFVGVG